MSTDPHLLPARRSHCARCLRPQSAQHDACICRWVTPVKVRTQVLILQHPIEQHHPKGSARLLHLSLLGSQLWVGEVFDGDVLARALQADQGAELHQAVLLYPDDSAELANTLCSPATAFAGARLLVVLDGTWRKSRKLLQLNPLLQRLPRLSLQSVATSRYAVRKAHQPHQLSTLEATCAALAQLEGHADRFAPLLEGFDGLVAHVAAQFLPPQHNRPT